MAKLSRNILLVCSIENLKKKKEKNSVGQSLMKKEIHFTILSKISNYVLFKVLASIDLHRQSQNITQLAPQVLIRQVQGFFFQITLQAKNGFTFKCSWKSFTLLISSLENFQVVGRGILQTINKIAVHFKNLCNKREQPFSLEFSLFDVPNFSDILRFEF